MKITFYGAAQTVTGSKHLLETQGSRILLDCGLQQGEHTGGDPEHQTLPFDAKTIDCVILSHAHADHCGMLPILVKNGFKGKIYCTGATADIAKFILIDSAMVQSMDSKYAQNHPGIPSPGVMYTKEEAENIFQYFEIVPYFRLTGQWTQINDRIRFKFYDAGHILGSAITYLEIKENDTIRGLAYTGDIGQPGAPILHDPEPVQENSDVLISEATYGGTKHKPLSDAAGQLREVIDFAIKNRGKIIIPAFALGRTQELVYILHDLTDRKIVQDIPIFVDSPLALNISEVFAKHEEDFDAETDQDFFSKNELPLAFKNLQYIHTVEESKALNTRPGPFIIISSSGMMEGGRILHHLKNNIEDPKNTILITGYQAEGTLGRKIHHGESPIQILGSSLNIRARVITMNEFSAHGDQDFLKDYIKNIQGLKNLFLVHTELPQAEALKEILEQGHPDFKITIPKLLESFEV
ncbi:MAG: MBL fold metallo-hydrolase [Candidatus Doudnabacteria bacterium]